MSALSYYLLSKVRHFSVAFLMLALFPLCSVQAAEKNTTTVSSKANAVAETSVQGAVNSSHVPNISAAQKEAAEQKAAGEGTQPPATGAAVNAAEGTAEGEQAAQHVLPESKSSSALYLSTFDASRKRCPFSKMVDSHAPVTDTTWYTDAAEDSDDGQEREPEDFRFDGRNKPNHASYERLPNIKVTGLMQVGGRRAVSANIQNKGVCILYENDNVVIEANAKTNLSKSLMIKKIHLNGMTVVLDDGNEITGKFY